MKSYIVDSFTKEKFKGNPAAVCMLEDELSDDLMQSIASEFNLSETAFIAQNAEHYSIRFFSPFMEIDLCGHATLASAKVLFEEFGLKNVEFITHKSLLLKAKRSENEIEMEFPLYTTEKATYPKQMLEALGIDKVLNCEFNKENNVLLLELEDAQELANLSPDFEALKRSHDSVNGVAITAISKDGFDFYSRYFWPWAGGNEDPVTGAIHTFLATYWSNKLEKKKLKAFQASTRGGYLNLEIVGDKLLIKSEAQIVLKGTIDLSST